MPRTYLRLLRVHMDIRPPGMTLNDLNGLLGATRWPRERTLARPPVL